MQDRLKFRYFDAEDEKMYDVKNICFVGEPTVTVAYKPVIKKAIYRGYLIQCTGLKDKNGKLIYEGDIVYKKGSKNYKKEKMYSLVCWDCMYAQFNISDENGMHQMPSNSNNIEVIGNIYENPELLNDNQKRAENLITNPESEILDSIKRAKFKTDICKTIKELIDNE